MNAHYTISYAVSPKIETDGLVSRPAARWSAELWFDGRRWTVDLTRNGQDWDLDVDPDDLEDAILPGVPDRATARRFAEKIRRAA